MDNALAIMTFESHGDDSAHGDLTLICKAGAEQLCRQFPVRQYGDSTGLFQIRYLDQGSARAVMLDPETNVRRASEMHKARGWQPWTNSLKKARNTGLIH